MPPKKTSSSKKRGLKEPKSVFIPPKSIDEEAKLYVCNQGHSISIKLSLLILDNYRDINRDGVEILKESLTGLYMTGMNILVKELGDGSGKYLVIDGAHRVVAWLELIEEGIKPRGSEVECSVYRPGTPAHILNLLASASNDATTCNVKETFIDKMRWVWYVCCFFCCCV
jgi:hypothetical protein